jgi:hypothetical protein
MEKNRILINSVKDKHEQIGALEDRMAWVTGMIKRKRSGGLSMEESKKHEETKGSIVQN